MKKVKKVVEITKREQCVSGTPVTAFIRRFEGDPIYKLKGTLLVENERVYFLHNSPKWYGTEPLSGCAEHGFKNAWIILSDIMPQIPNNECARVVVIHPKKGSAKVETEKSIRSADGRFVKKFVGVTMITPAAKAEMTMKAEEVRHERSVRHPVPAGVVESSKEVKVDPEKPAPAKIEEPKAEESKPQVIEYEWDGMRYSKTLIGSDSVANIREHLHNLEIQVTVVGSKIARWEKLFGKKSLVGAINCTFERNDGMNIEEVKVLSGQELRIKVAELCRWKCVHRSGSWIIGWTDKPSMEVEIPDYCEDLNAMHEAEKVIVTPKQHSKYIQGLCMLHGAKHVYMATARQRAEAFVLTMEGE